MGYKKIYRIFSDSTIIEPLLKSDDENIKKQAIQLSNELYMFDELFTTEKKAREYQKTSIESIKKRYNLIAEKVNMNQSIYIDDNYCKCKKCNEFLWDDDIAFHNCI
jgi:RNase P subunit RPR2